MDVIRETGGYGGDVLINGEKVSFSTPFDALEAGIGMVHQEFSLYRDSRQQIIYCSTVNQRKRI